MVSESAKGLADLTDLRQRECTPSSNICISGVHFLTYIELDALQACPVEKGLSGLDQLAALLSMPNCFVRPPVQKAAFGELNLVFGA